MSRIQAWVCEGLIPDREIFEGLASFQMAVSKDLRLEHLKHHHGLLVHLELINAMLEAYRIAGNGKLSEGENFANFAFLWLFAKIFSAKFRGVVSFGVAQVRNPQKFSPQKSYFSPICESFFSLESFLLYGNSWAPFLCVIICLPDV